MPSLALLSKSILQDARQQLGMDPSSCAAAGTMAPFNFTQRSSSRTAIKVHPEDSLKMDKLDLSTPTAPVKEAQLQAPGSRFSGKMGASHGTFEPSKAFVRQLAAKSEYRCVSEEASPVDDGKHRRSWCRPHALPIKRNMLHDLVDW